MSICINASETVASGSFLDQSGNLSETAIYTPDSAGMYRLNLTTTYVQANTTIGIIVYWNDGVEDQSQGAGVGLGGPPFNLYSVSGEPISISFSVSADTASLYWSIEKL